MKNKIGILILCLFCQFCFGQIESRKNSQVRNDLAPVENVIVFDANSKAGAIVNEYGFTVLAKVNDTLVFKSDIQI
jgi:hypothetical protein